MRQLNTFDWNFDLTNIAVPAQGRVRCGYFKGFEALVENLGGDSQKILEHSGVDPLVFADVDSDIECLAAVYMLEYASKQLKTPLFGLHLAERQTPDVFGCAIALARSAQNFGQALQCLIDYVPVSASPECELEMVSSRQVAELRWRAPYGLGDQGQVNYHGVLLIMKTLRMLGSDYFCPRYASLALSIGRQEKKLIEESLGCKVNSRAATNAIAFPVEMLNRPVSTFNKTLYSLLSSGLTQLRTISKASFMEQVKANVRRSILERRGILEDCSKKMKTSPRTLQKRLEKVGVKLSEIIQTERIKLAQHSLHWSDASLDEIALQLGYAEQTSFGRAFKRETGLTPKEFRMQQNL